MNLLPKQAGNRYPTSRCFVFRKDLQALRNKHRPASEERKARGHKTTGRARGAPYFVFACRSQLVFYHTVRKFARVFRILFSALGKIYGHAYAFFFFAALFFFLLRIRKKRVSKTASAAIEHKMTVRTTAFSDFTRQTVPLSPFMVKHTY